MIYELPIEGKVRLCPYCKGAKLCREYDYRQGEFLCLNCLSRFSDSRPAEEGIHLLFGYLCLYFSSGGRFNIFPKGEKEALRGRKKEIYGHSN